MKKLHFSIACLLAITAITSRAQITTPGWYNASVQDALSMPDDTTDSPSTTTPPAMQPQYSVQSLLVSTNPPGIAEAITPEIQALADGLRDDPLQIYKYVHDHIKYVLYFGSKKGAGLTLLEKSGNDFDQSALLVALLRAAGYNATEQFGWMELPYDAMDGTHNDLHHWLQLNVVNTSWMATSNYLYSLFYTTRFYPTIDYLCRHSGHSSDTNTFLFQRVWVTMTVGGTNYYLDPAFKVSEPVASIINLGSVMGFSSNSVMSAAGGTDTNNYVTNLNEASLNSALTGYATNLVGYIEYHSPSVSVQQILGGWQTVAATNAALPTSLLFSTYSYANLPAMNVTNWVNEPTNLMATLRLTFAGTNYQWFVPQLEGQRLAMTYDANGLAQLWQDDALLAQRSTGVADTNLAFFIKQPDGAWDFTNNVLIPRTNATIDLNYTNSYQRTNATYAFTYAFEPDWGWLQQRQNMLDAYLSQGLTNGTRQVTSETLNIMGLNWMLQTERAGNLLEAQMGILPQYHCRLGRVAQESGHGYYVDVYMESDGFIANSGTDAASQSSQNREFDLFGYFESALEHGIIEQLQSSNLVGASTIKMLEIADTNGQAVYLASKANWTTVESKLVNYDAATLNSVASYVNSNYFVLLPQNGSNHVAGAGSWTGYGYAAILAGQVGTFAISGGYHGAYAARSTDTVNTPFVQETGDNQPTAFTETGTSTSSPTVADPVDAADGTFQVEHTDLSLGQAEPRGITLSRYYNGTRRFSNPAGISGGWTHNYIVTANTVAAPQAGLGGTTPAQAAAMMAATCAAIGVYNDTQPDPKNWMVATLIAKWGVDQLAKNGVSVNLGKDTLQFVQQPDGSFTPPANCTATLTQTNSAYSLLMRHGNEFNFDSLGRLASIVDPYSQTLNVSYLSSTSGLPQTVTDWKGRTLTFAYTGNQLTSVSDGTRTVSYFYMGNNVLGDFSDAEGQFTAYEYDNNNNLTLLYDSFGRLVISNSYDALGHVNAQCTQGNTNKAWHIYWSGWQTIEQDPAGGQRAFSYDDQGRLTGLRDQLGNLTQTVYDGQNQVVSIVSPLNETNSFSHDSNHNLIRITDALGFKKRFYYDSQNNLVESMDPLADISTYSYNAQFSPTGQTNGAGDWVNYTYNSDGTLASRTDAGGTTQYGYDGYGQLSSIAYLGISTNSFVNNSLGDVVSHTDGNGNVATFSYNNRRELTNSVVSGSLTNSVAIDAVGNVAGTTDARGNVTANTWSVTRHLLATTLPAVATGTPVLTNVYDNRDWLVGALDPLKNQMLYTNDAAGRLISQTDPLQRRTAFRYDADGRNISTTNPSQEVTSQSWDAKGERIQLTDGGGHVSLRAYDSAGNQIILTNRNGNVWQFQFDGANRLTNTVSPRGYATTVAFNHQGMPATVKDALGQITSLAYDGKGRLTNRMDNAGTNIYTYDANDNLTGVTNVGQASSLSQTFDAYNRVSTFKDIYGNLIQYHYDANGNLTNLIYPGGRNVYYAYDSNNHMTSVTDWAGRKTVVTHDLDGRVTSITRPNGTYRTLSYDAAGQTTNILEQMANGLPISWFRFNWNPNSTVGWEFAAPLPHTNTPPLRNMTYDADNRLWQFQGPTMGSLQSVMADNDGNLTYGPLTNDTFATYAYDARNRLLNVGGVTNGYDAMNNRIGQTYGTNWVTYVINPNAALPEVLMRIKNDVTNYYIYGPGLLYQVTETGAATNTLTYHYDYRGSTLALSGDNGLVTDRMEYSLYATLNYRAGTNDTPFLFNGRFGVMTDPNGLLYMRARYYNPYLCRFINPDPSGFAGGLNFYAYANGNPVSYLDAAGLNAVATGDAVFDWAPKTTIPWCPQYTWNNPQYPLNPQNPFGIGSTDGGASGYYQTASSTLNIVGIAQFGAEFGSGAASIGINNASGAISFYSHFYGNQYTSAIMLRNIAKGATPYFFVAGSGVDIYGAATGQESPAQAAINLSVGYIGFRGMPFMAASRGGPIGAAFAVGYGGGSLIQEDANGAAENVSQVLTDMYYDAPYGPYFGD